MPLFKRKPYVLRKPPKDLLRDEDVFQVRFTKEVFRDYKYPPFRLLFFVPLGLGLCSFFFLLSYYLVVCLRVLFMECRDDFFQNPVVAMHGSINSLRIVRSLGYALMSLRLCFLYLFFVLQWIEAVVYVSFL